MAVLLSVELLFGILHNFSSTLTPCGAPIQEAHIPCHTHARILDGNKSTGPEQNPPYREGIFCVIFRCQYLTYAIAAGMMQDRSRLRCDRLDGIYALDDEHGMAVA
jgi:hypothetical protein